MFQAKVLWRTSTSKDSERAMWSRDVFVGIATKQDTEQSAELPEPPAKWDTSLTAFSLGYSETFWEACDVCVSSDRWEGTCGNRFRTKILVSPKGRTVRPPQTQRGTHSFKGVLIPALSQAGLNWRLWFPGYPEGWVPLSMTVNKTFVLDLRNLPNKTVVKTNKERDCRVG